VPLGPKQVEMEPRVSTSPADPSSTP
jgi:hypothetical protein